MNVNVLINTTDSGNSYKENTNEIKNIVDLCDASTVINFSLKKKEKESKKPESDVLIIDSDDKISSLDTEIRGGESEDSISRLHKVVGWLKQSQFEAHEEVVNLEESEKWIVQTCLNEDSSNSMLFSKNIRRTRVFLLDIEPNPDSEPLDLVSGYCHSGCKKLCVFSNIHWIKVDGLDTPSCPSCQETDGVKELKLMFKVKLHVMDSNGLHSDLNLWKEHAEEFFGCEWRGTGVESSSVNNKCTLPYDDVTTAPYRLLCAGTQNYYPDTAVH